MYLGVFLIGFTILMILTIIAGQTYEAISNNWEWYEKNRKKIIITQFVLLLLPIPYLSEKYLNHTLNIFDVTFVELGVFALGLTLAYLVKEKKR